MDLIRRIFRTSLIILFPVATASALIEWKKLPVSILVGGILGLANLKGLAWGVGGLLGSQRAGGRMVIFSLFRLIMLFLILSTLVYLKLVNIFGILAGLTIVFTLVVTEGLKYAREQSDSERK